MKKLLSLLCVLFLVLVSPTGASRQKVQVYARVGAGIAPPRVTNVEPRDEMFIAQDTVQEFQLSISQNLEDDQESSVYYNIDTTYGNLSHSQGKINLQNAQDVENINFAYKSPVRDEIDGNPGPYDEITITLNDTYNFTSKQITIYVY